MTTYCDNCGEAVVGEEFFPYEECPVATDSTNIGESAVLCEVCNQELIVDKGIKVTR